MIYRTFFCLNKYCKHEFTVTDSESPPCPRCDGTQVKWIPATKGVISGKTRQADADVKALQASFGDQNYNSPVRGERAAPRPTPTVAGRTRKFEPIPGWAINMPENVNGQLDGGAFCAPTGVVAPVKAAVGTPIPVAANSATPTGAVPVIEASHKGAVR